MAKVAERHYVSSEPGNTLTLPEGITYKDPFNRDRRTLNFPARGGKMVKTSDPKIQDFIEGVKDKNGEFTFNGQKYSKLPCRAFQKGIIQRISTPEEIKEREIKKKQEETLVTYRELMAKPGVNLDLKQMSDVDIRELAQNIGVETSGEGKKLSQAEIAKNVEQKIFGK